MNYLRCNFLFLFLFFFAAKAAQGQAVYNPDIKFTPAQLKKDLAVLREVLDTVHIGLYRYTSKKKIDSLFEISATKLNIPLTEAEFFKIVNQIVVNVRDEHTFALPSAGYMDNEIGQTIYSASPSKSKAKLFPFFVRILNNRLYVDNNLCDELTINRGDEIISINGKPVREILDILLPTIPTNGYIETFRLRHLEQFSLQQTYNRFIVHYAIYIGRPDVFELVIKPFGGDDYKKVTINALTSNKIYNYYWRRYSTTNDMRKKRENPLEFKFLTNNTAYIRLSDFHTPTWIKYNYSYSTEFRTIADLLKEKAVKNLVIDLRDNEGGNLAIGAELLKYLCIAEYRPYNYHEVKNYKFPSLKQYLRDTSALPNYPDELFIPTNHGTFRSNPNYKTETMSRPMQPAATAYKNKLYVLVNGATGSAGAIFATLIRVNRKDATFIGEESGADMEGPVSGSGTDILLPNTKIRVDIPFIKRMVNLNGYPNTKGRGIFPEYTVPTDVKDIATNEDTQLKFTMDLINKK